MAHTHAEQGRHHGQTDGYGYSVIFALGFAVFLVIALIGTVLGWHWRTWLPGAEGMKSLFGGVKAAVYTFMSHLL